MLGPFCQFNQDIAYLVAGLLVPVFLLWQLLERVLWRRAWQGPLKCVRVFVPWVRFRDARTACQRVVYDPKEEQERGE